MTALYDLTDHADQLHSATHALEEAIHSLIGPRRGVVAGRIRLAPSIYDTVRSDLAGQQGTGMGNAARSLPPAWLAAIDWLREVDDTCRTWWIENDATTTARLDALSRWQWTPADLVTVEDIAGRVNAWVRRAESLLDARLSFAVSGSCPECGVSATTAVDALGETMRTPVLRASVDGANCAACKAFWTPNQLAALADIIRRQ